MAFDPQNNKDVGALLAKDHNVPMNITFSKAYPALLKEGYNKIEI